MSNYYVIGGVSEDQLRYFSCVQDPLNWDYSPKASAFARLVQARRKANIDSYISEIEKRQDEQHEKQPKDDQNMKVTATITPIREPLQRLSEVKNNVVVRGETEYSTPFLYFKGDNGKAMYITSEGHICTSVSSPGDITVTEVLGVLTIEINR